MSVAGVGGQGGSAALDSLSNSGSESGDMDKEQFLELLVMQLQNQDPMKPKDPSEFVAQLTQFSSLEALANIKTGLDMMAITQTSATHASMVQFVGKEVEFSDNIVSIDDEMKPVELEYSLGGEAAGVTIMIQDEDGNKVRTIELGPQQPGRNTFSFDGIDEKGLKLPPGEYTFSVAGRTGTDQAVPTDTIGSGLVHSVSFEKGYPELIMHDGRRIDLGQVLAVTKDSGGVSAAIEAILDDTSEQSTEHQPIDEESS